MRLAHLVRLQRHYDGNQRADSAQRANDKGSEDTTAKHPRQEPKQGGSTASQNGGSVQALKRQRRASRDCRNAQPLHRRQRCNLARGNVDGVSNSGQS